VLRLFAKRLPVAKAEVEEGDKGRNPIVFSGVWGIAIWPIQRIDLWRSGSIPCKEGA